MIKEYRILIMLVLLLLSGSSLFGGGTIEATGSWTVDLDQTDLSPASTAGANFVTSIESATNQIDVDITFIFITATWYVTIHKVDTVWDPDVTISIRRTGNGTGSGSISGGLNYLAVINTAQEFFRVSRTRSNIPVQLQLSGLSVPLMNSGTYTTTLVYTLTSTL